VILTPDAVKGIIEVKANLQNQGINQIIRQANENGQFIFSGKDDKKQKFFNGVFSFEGYENNFDQNIFVNAYLQSNEGFDDAHFSKYKVNHVCLNKDWKDDANPHSLYNIHDLSFSFFISNLTDFLSNKSVKKNNFIWYATNKELNLIRQF
jgi:flagellin-like hook-associated protein FlgL